MTKQVQRRRGTATQHTSFTGAEGEISVNTTNKSIHVHDGVTAGGIEGARADMTNVSDGDLNSRLAGNTLSSLTITSADINGGTIDGTVIGGTTPAAGNFTTGSFTGNATFGDNDKAIFGAGSDLQIYHDTSASYISDQGAGPLNVLGSQINMYNAAEDTQFASWNSSAVKTYIGGSLITNTTDTGVDITGTLTSDGLTVDGGSAKIVSANVTPFYSASDLQTVRGAVGLARAGGDDTLNVLYSYTNTSDLDNVALTARHDINLISDGDTVATFFRTGDISFFEDTGTTPKFHWSASAESLALGGWSSPDTALQLYTNAAGITPLLKLMSNRSSNDGTEGASIDFVASGDQTAVGSRIVGTRAAAGANMDLRFHTGRDTERMRIDSDGNVGIGTSPAVKFHVKDTFSALSFEHSGGNAVLKIDGGNGDLSGTDYSSIVDTGGTLLFGTNGGSEAMRIDSDGNVGIGTSSPLSKLHIENTSGNDGIRIINSTSGEGYVIFGDTGDSNVGSIAYNHSSDAMTFDVNNSERMRIDSSGNVGIGTSSPNADLELGGAGEVLRLSGSPTTAYIRNTDGTTNQWYIGSGGNAGLQHYIYQAQPMTFHTTGAERMRIDASGNILVATTSVSGPDNGLGGTTFGLASFDRAVLEMGHSDTSTTQRTMINFYSGSGSGRVGFVACNNTTTSYNTSSDYRLKEDVQPMTGASDRLQSLKPCNFAWKADGTRVDGFLAHEAQEVVPEAVTGEKDGEKMQAIDQSKLVPLLTAALQEALTKIDALETRITTLEG